MFCINYFHKVDKIEEEEYTIVSLVTAATLTCTSLATTGLAYTPYTSSDDYPNIAYMRGDVNQSGDYEIEDASMALEEYVQAAADPNAEGSLTLDDEEYCCSRRRL